MNDRNNLKFDNAYKTIGEAAKELNLIDKKTGNLQTHTLRYWEKQFKEIKPLIRAGKRRYYSENDLKTIKLIKFLLKDKGMTIDGAKRILKNKNSDKLDLNINKSINNSSLKNNKAIKEKLNKIKKILKELNRYK
tara:strand:- start:2078 stop:2482 length:405 start_codon:yes stop_codon:yes gene_type:complete